MTEYREPGPVTEDELRAEVERLRADAASAWEEVSRVQQVGLRAESRLSAATKLLRDAPYGWVGDWQARRDTFLAAQPAEPRRKDRPTPLTEWERENVQPAAPDVRTVRVSAEGMGTPQRFTMTVQPTVHDVDMVAHQMSSIDLGYESGTARTEAEQRVLDACSALPQENLECVRDGWSALHPMMWPVCMEELARREPAK